MFQYTPQRNDSHERHTIPHGRATVPRPPHTATLGVLGERLGATVQPGERGA